MKNKTEILKFKILKQMIIFICFITLVLSENIVYSQQYYTPTSPLIVTRDHVNIDYIRELLEQPNLPTYTQSDFDEVSNNVQLNDLRVDAELEKKWKEITDLLTIKSEINRRAGIEEMQQQLVEKKNAKEKIKTDLEEALKNIDFYGFYAMLVPVPAEERFRIRNSDIKTQGRPFLAAQSIEALNGLFISSLTVVE
ncbi:MAG: hypothetical protein PHT69_04535, partial [Bacteroidales bacterium]|nr:hypothetical protein [Bacteroidales bacterium]